MIQGPSEVVVDGHEEAKVDVHPCPRRTEGGGTRIRGTRTEGIRGSRTQGIRGARTEDIRGTRTEDIRGTRTEGGRVERTRTARGPRHPTSMGRPPRGTLGVRSTAAPLGTAPRRWG